MTTKKKTIRQKLIAGLTACGYKESFERSTSKYIALIGDDQTCKMFVGKSGALRVGRVASQSVSLEGTRTREAFIKVGELSASIASVEQARRIFADHRTATEYCIVSEGGILEDGLFSEAEALAALAEYDEDDDATIEDRADYVDSNR